MRKILRSLVTLASMSLLVLSVSAQEAAERKATESGSMHHGSLEPQVGPAIPEKDLAVIDFDSLRKVEGRWEKLLNKTHRLIPPLEQIPLEGTQRAPSYPETALGDTDKAPGDFVLIRNSMPSDVTSAGFRSIVAEPAVAASRTNVFYTGNWFAASSDNKGATFSLVNPFLGPNPDPSSGSFCCDQLVTYAPSTNTLFYLQQFLNNATTGVQRINVDQEGDGTFDCFYDISPQTAGFASANWSDFPDMAASNDHLFLSTNVFSATGAGFTGAFVMRLNLASIAACSSVPFDTYMDTSGFFSFKLTRGATTQMFFADHISTSSMRIWRWQEGNTAPTFADRTVANWSNATRICVGPDGRDMCGFIDRRLAAAYVADGTVGFAWVPAQDGSFPQPYTRFAQFDEGTLALTGQPLVWSGSVAFIYPSVAVNSNGDLGGSMMANSSGLHPTCIVWLADDVNSDNLAPLDNQIAYTGLSGPSINRTGDYNSAATNYPNDKLFVGACFGYPSSGASQAHFILFGRDGDHSIFADGFETGNTSRW